MKPITPENCRRDTTQHNVCRSEPESSAYSTNSRKFLTYKLEQADVLPQRPDAAGETQGEGDSAHCEDQPHGVEAVHPGDLGEIQQDALQTAQTGEDRK